MSGTFKTLPEGDLPCLVECSGRAVDATEASVPPGAPLATRVLRKQIAAAPMIKASSTSPSAASVNTSHETRLLDPPVAFPARLPGFTGVASATGTDVVEAVATATELSVR